MNVRGRRPERVGERIREELAALMQGGLRDPRVGFTTVTGVRVTPDLREAHIYVSVLGPEEEQQQSLEGLSAASGFLRRELSHRLELRRVPELRFELDRSNQYAERIERLLRENPPAAKDEEENDE